jgi:hypothetical protein
LVCATRPADCSRRFPPLHTERIAVTLASVIGSPNSSTIRPAITLPRGIAMSALSIVCASASSIDLPASNGRVCPYCTLTNPDLVAATVKRPAGSWVNSYRPSASVSIVFAAISGPVTRTVTRRTGWPVSADRIRPRMRPVPVLRLRGPPIPGSMP